MAVNKTLPVAFFPVATHRNEYHYNFLPGKLRANLPVPKVKNPIVLEADAVILDIKSPDWLSYGESEAISLVITADPDPSLEAALQIPPYLKQEILSIGFPVLSETVSSVETEGTLDDTLRVAQKTIEKIDDTAREDSPMVYELKKTLEDVSALTRSIRSLTDYIERRPESLIRGK